MILYNLGAFVFLLYESWCSATWCKDSECWYLHCALYTQHHNAALFVSRLPALNSLFSDEIIVPDFFLFASDLCAIFLYSTFLYHFVLDVSYIDKAGSGFVINSKILLPFLNDFTTFTFVNMTEKFGLSSAALFYVMLLVLLLC